MKKFGPVMALLLIMALCITACSGGNGMNGSVKLNEGTLAVDNAKDIYEMAEQTEAITNASWELFKNTYSSDKSSMISPFSIIQALGVCVNGCKGETLTEIESALGCNAGKLNEWALAYGAMLRAPEKPVMVNSNAVWFNANGFKVNEDFPDITAAYYGADTYQAPFDATTVDDINNWVKDKTKDRIDQLVSGLNDSAKSVIVNAAAFDGTWVDPYDVEDVETGSFTDQNGEAHDADMMMAVENQYISGTNFTGFRKYYENGYSFVAMLPEEGLRVEEFVASMNGEKFRAALNNSEYGIVTTKLPKFKCEYTADNVIGAMHKMGINSLFDVNSADLSGMGTSSEGNLFIGDIVHKTYIDVNESGTEAAAATGLVAMAAGAPPEREYSVILDRPFVYAIIDDATDTPIFIGNCMSVE